MPARGVDIYIISCVLDVLTHISCLLHSHVFTHVSYLVFFEHIYLPAVLLKPCSVAFVSWYCTSPRLCRALTQELHLRFNILLARDL